MELSPKLVPRLLAYVLAVTLIVTMTPAMNVFAALPTDAGATTLANGNIARATTCTAVASYYNTTNGGNEAQIARIKDGALGVGAGTSWNSWNTNVFPVTVTYTWTQPYLIDATRVMWWYDGTGSGSGVTLPGAVALQYNVGTAANPIWTPVPNMKNAAGTAVTTVGNQGGGTNGTNRIWNGVTFDPIVTTQLRFSISKGIGTGVGIGEWEVFGELAPPGLYSVRVTGDDEIFTDSEFEYTAETTTADLADVGYAWTLDNANATIVGANNARTVKVKGVSAGNATLTLTATHTTGVQTAVATKTIKVTETKLTSVTVAGDPRLFEEAELTYTASVFAPNLTGVAYEWTLDNTNATIVGSNTGAMVKLRGVKDGPVKLTVKATHASNAEAVYGTFDVSVLALKAQTYVTNTAAGQKPILPKRVVLENLLFDVPTAHTGTGAGGTGYDFAEEFNDSLVPVKSWEAVSPALYAADKVGTTFTVNGIVEYDGREYPAKTTVTVKEALAAPETNHSVTSENVTFDDTFWKPKQVVNATSSFDAAFLQLAGTGSSWDEEHNFINAKARLAAVRAGNMSPPMGLFRGYVFADTDIYKTLEAVAYNLAAVWDDPTMDARKIELQDKLDYWIDLIESIQYADGYINAAFSNRTSVSSGGSGSGNWRWRYMDRHEMYNIGHFLEAVVAYTRYREGVGLPDYRLYEVGKRAADHIVALFGPGGKRVEVPGHEEVELGLMKMATLVEEYEGTGTGDKYRATAKLLVDRRGNRTGANARQSGYSGGTYSQDATALINETKAVGHAVRAMYYYTGATDVATWLNETEPSAATPYLNVLDRIWQNATERNTYITGGIGSSQPGSSSEGFGSDYALSNTQSYCEICAAIAMSNWNQRLNLVHEDAKYADSYERSLFNGSLVGVSLAGGRFYYSTPIERTTTNSTRHLWESVACCEPNILRTIANLGGYLYTVKKNDLFVNMYAGSTASVNVEGTDVSIEQKTNYPWDANIAMTVKPAVNKAFTMNIRIPGWVKAQKNQQVSIKVDGKRIDATPNAKGYVLISRTWPASGTLINIDIPMEVRMTEPDNNVHNIGDATHSNRDRVAIERGPIVYCLEDAGTATTAANTFNATQVVYPRSMEFNVVWRPDLLRGVVALTGTAIYNGAEREVTLTPYYAWNNRGTDPANLGNGATNSSGRMVVWANTTGSDVEIRGAKNNLKPEEETTLTAVPRVNYSAGTAAMPDAYQWTILSGPGQVIGAPIFAQAPTAGYEKIGGVLGVDGGNTTNTLKYFASTATVKATANGVVTVKVEALNGGSVLYTDTYEITVGEEPKEPVNTLLLKLTVALYDGKFLENNTTGKAWADFTKAINDAKAIIAEPEDYTQAQVDAAQKAIEDTAKAVLANPITTIALETYIDLSKVYLDNEDLYLGSAVTALKAALAAAEEALAIRESQAKIDKAADDILAVLSTFYEKGNKTALQALVSLVSRYAPDSYTPASWDIFAKALDDAQKVIANPDAIAESVNDAYTALIGATAGLTRKAYFGALNASITLARQIVDNIGDYVPSTVVGLTEGLDGARAVAENLNATQAEVNAAAEAINAKILAARLKADLSGLLSAITRARALEESRYTAESYKSLTTAVTGAEAVLSAAPEVTQADVDGATQAVDNAIVTLAPRAAAADIAGGKTTVSDVKTVIPKVKILKITARGKTKIVVKWAKVPSKAKITGYQVQYRVKGAAKWKNKKTVSAKSASLTIKGLKKNKKYQIRIRAYRSGSGTKDYGAWSALKIGKTRK